MSSCNERWVLAYSAVTGCFTIPHEFYLLKAVWSILYFGLLFINGFKQFSSSSGLCFFFFFLFMIPYKKSETRTQQWKKCEHILHEVTIWKNVFCCFFFFPLRAVGGYVKLNGGLNSHCSLCLDLGCVGWCKVFVQFSCSRQIMSFQGLAACLPIVESALKHTWERIKVPQVYGDFAALLSPCTQPL